MVIVVVKHVAGWKYHVPIDGDSLTIGSARDNDIVLADPNLAEHHATLAVRDVVQPVRFGEYTLELEHHHDEVEHTLLAAIARGDDASHLVYADWLEQHERPNHAAFLRTQLEIVQRTVDEPEFAALSRRLRELTAELPYGWCSHLARPVIRLGDRSELAFQIGLARADAPQQRQVQIWAAGIELTCDDDTVHVPSYAYSISIAAQRVGRRLGAPYPDRDPVAIHRQLDADEATRSVYRWLDCGPTTDNLVAFLFHDRAEVIREVIVTFAFWRPTHPRPHELGQVFVLRLREDAVIARLRRLAEILRRGI